MTKKPQKILIVDDHPVVLEGLKNALQKEPDFEVVGTAHDGLKAIEMVDSLRPDIVIMDNAMPHLEGLEATEQIKNKFNETRIVMYSMFSDKELVYALFQAGISGYVLKGRPVSEMILALKSVAAGGTFYSEAIGMNLRQYLSENRSGDPDREEHIIERLSSREREVFLLLADGVPVKKIAQRLFISPKTVDTHKYNIMDKLNVATVAQLTKIAVREKLIKL